MEIQNSKITINPELVGAQFDFYEDDETKFLHLSAGFGFGKTTVLCYKLLKLSILNRPFDGGIVCPSFTDFKRDVLPSLVGILEKHDIPYEYHGTDHHFKFPWSSGYLRVFTAEKKLRGPNMSYIGLNELGLIPFERYQEAIGRVRIKGAPCPQVVSSGTPDQGLSSPYYQIFVENPWKNSKILFGSTRENAHNLSPTYIQSLYESYPKLLLDAFMEGQFVNITGNRFYFSYDQTRNDNANLKPNEDTHFFCGIDFNVQPFCASIWQRQGSKIVCLDEIVLSGGEGYDTKNMITALESRGYGPYNTILYPDPSGNSRSTKGLPDIKVLENHGFTCRVKNVAPRFRERQINVNNLLEKGIIQIHPKCKAMKKDLVAVECDPVTLQKKKNNPALTHLSDGMDYMIDIEFPFSGKKAASEIKRFR